MKFKPGYLLAVLAAGVAAYVLVLVYRGVFSGPLFSGNRHDFLAFYNGAYFALHGRISELYDPAALIAFQRTIVPYAVGFEGYMPFMNPPVLALMMAPLAILSVGPAREVWLLLNTVLAVVAVLLVTQPLPVRSRLVAGLMLFGTFPMFQALIEGQPSIILLLGCLLAYFAGRRGRWLLCGALLAVLGAKPQLAVIAFAALIILRQWRALVGMSLAMGALFLASLPFTGLGLYVDYGHYLAHVIQGHVAVGAAVPGSAWHGSVKLMAGLNGWYTALCGPRHLDLVTPLSVATLAVLLGLLVLAWRRVGVGTATREQALLSAATVTLALLADPHLYQQDVVLLYLVLPLLYRHESAWLATGVVVGACALLRIDQHRSEHFFTVLAVAGITAVVLGCGRKSADSRRAKPLEVRGSTSMGSGTRSSSMTPSD